MENEKMENRNNTHVLGRNNTVRWIGTIAVLAHLIVVVLHGSAHTALRVELNAWQNIYVMTVILLAPLVAVVILWTRYHRLGLLVLLVSMAGSLVFGACYHYFIVSPDHVSHLPPGDARGLFRTTALLLLLTEMFGIVVALFGLGRAVKNA
jgi:hypothetical protein